MINLYRLYNENNEYKQRVWAVDYEDAIEYLNPREQDKLFFVEKDNFEIPCGRTWENYR